MKLPKKKEAAAPPLVENPQVSEVTGFDTERHMREFSHLTGVELGTLLGTIVGQVDFALSQPTAEIREQSMRIVLKAAERATSLSRNLRYFASHSRFDIRPVDLSQVLLNTVDLVEKELTARSIYPFVTADASSYALVDEAALRQCLLNIIAYAAHSMAKGGRLVLTLRQTETQLEITLNDSGAGIYPPELEKPLQSLLSEAPSGAGTDGSLLGIVVAKSLLEVQGGTLSTTSTLRGGTTFHVRVPRYELTMPRSPFREKRRTRRVDVRLPAEVTFEKEPMLITEIRTLGKYGAFIAIPNAELMRRLNATSRVSLKLFYFQKETIEIPRARVAGQVQSEGLSGIGVEFEEIGNKARKILSAILKSHFS